MPERRRLSEEQLKTLDSLIEEIAQRNLTGIGRPPVEDWWDVVENVAEDVAVHFAMHADEVAEWVADHPEVVAAVATAIGFETDAIDQLPPDVVEKFRQAGPMPSLEDLVLIRQRYR